MVPTTEQPQEKKKRKRKRKRARSRKVAAPKGNSYEGRFSRYQRELYKRAIFGLSLYTQKEINQMHWERRDKIKRNQKLAQQVLNCMKQEVLNWAANQIFAAFFPDSPDAQYILETPITDTDPDLETDINFSHLGITKLQVVDRLIEAGILPVNFYRVKVDPNAKYKLPRLKQDTNETRKQNL